MDGSLLEAAEDLGNVRVCAVLAGYDRHCPSRDHRKAFSGLFRRFGRVDDSLPPWVVRITLMIGKILWEEIPYLYTATHGRVASTPGPSSAF